jgi:uncharacterized damage-inducible protein DinB
MGHEYNSSMPEITVPALLPERAIFLRDAIGLPSLRNEHAVTRRIIEAIPVDKGDYRPDQVSKSAVDLAYHIAGAEHRFMDAVVNGAFDFTTPRPDGLTTSADVARWYADTFATDFDRVAALSADQLMKPTEFRGILRLPAIAYIQIALNHSIHHRGQLSMYLRPMGAPVPAIYGESYDSAKAKTVSSR